MRWPRAAGWCWAAIFVAALVLRLVAGWWWQERLPAGAKFGFGDSEGYWELGRTIARGQAYQYGDMKIFRTPGYPAVLAPLFWLADGALPRVDAGAKHVHGEPPVMWGRVLSAVLSTAAVGGVGALAWLLFGQRTGLVAAALAAVYPEAIALGAFVLSEAPFAPLMLLHLILWTLAWRGESRGAIVGWSLAAGVAAGLATLMRPSFLLFVPFAGAVGVVVALAARNGAGERNTKTQRTLRQAQICGVMLVGLCLTMAPWWVRNYRVAGKFVPTSLQVGASLYDGLNPQATGASDMRFVERFVAEQQAADAQPGADKRGLFEDRLDRRLRDAALAWSRANPGRAVQLAAIKFARMWSPLPNAAEFQSPLLRVILAATYTPLIVLAAIGAWRYARRDWPYLLCTLPAVYFTCLHVVFVSSIRYRQPAMLALVVLAAGAIAGFRVQGSGFRRAVGGQSGQRTAGRPEHGP